MHVLTIIRMYLGLSQVALAKAAGITQPDLCEMETLPPYGRVDKYRRIAKTLSLPLDPILKDDISTIPLSFFEKHPPHPYLPTPSGHKQQIGREGEDFIFVREQARLLEALPVHARLVLPLYKMKGQRIGYDILSFDENGKPIFLEVKTSCEGGSTFSMTRNELETAQKLTNTGEQYVITYITNWRKANRRVRDVPFGEFLSTYDVAAHRYSCSLKKEEVAVTGLAHFRRLRALKEREVAETLDIPEYKWSLYETGTKTPPVQVLLRASELLDAPIDQLLARYNLPEV